MAIANSSKENEAKMAKLEREAQEQKNMVGRSRSPRMQRRQKTLPAPPQQLALTAPRPPKGRGKGAKKGTGKGGKGKTGSTQFDGSRRRGLSLQRFEGDRDELLLDYRFVDFLLRAAMDLERHLGTFAQGVKVGLGTRMPTMYRSKWRWRPSEQRDPRNYMEEESQAEHPWRQNYATLAGLADEIAAVLEDQVTRHQVIKLTEAEAAERFPSLVIASLGANRKESQLAYFKTEQTAWRSILVPESETKRGRSPIASDLKRAMREKSEVNQPTFALTVDVSEAHRQVPIHRSDWLSCARTWSRVH